MQPFVFENWQGTRYKLCDVTGTPSSQLGWQYQELFPGQAALFVHSLEQAQQQQLKTWFNNRLGFSSVDPQRGVAQLLEAHRLRLYREPAYTSKGLVVDDAQTIESLYLDIRAELNQILARERQETAKIDKDYKAGSSSDKAAAHAKAGGLGLIEAGESLINWLSDINDVVNPLCALKRRVDAALETYEEFINDTDATVDLALVSRYLHRVEIKDHKELVEALGFDPAKIDFDDFSEAWHTAWILAGDQIVVDMISAFAKDYVGAQHSLELTRMAGGAVFEILLTILLAVATGGVGAAASLGAKARYASAFEKIGRKLKALAKLIADKTRQVTRVRRQKFKLDKDRKDGDSQEQRDLSLDKSDKDQQAATNSDKKDKPSRPLKELEPGDKSSGWNKELNKHPLDPNTDYKVGPYLYQTDESGRIEKVSGTLNLEERNRNTHQQTKSAKKDGIKDGRGAAVYKPEYVKGDDGGHLIASIFDGPGEQINYVPMDSNLNRGAWKAMEDDWAQALGKEPPDVVKVEIEPIYVDESGRPEALKVKYWINDKPEIVFFENEPITR